MVVSSSRPDVRPGRRLALTLAVVLALVGGLFTVASSGAQQAAPRATPRAECGPGSRPETSTQGRVPSSDYASGRAARGYTCNTRLVSRQGSSGGFKVHRYTDSRGNTCAYYDSSLLVGRDVVQNLLSGDGLGVVVLDMNDPKRPRKVGALASLAMLSPHESLVLNKKRGLLAAGLGTAATLPGVVDIYDVRTDCRKPRLLSSSPTGLLGHESGFSPDGRTLYIAGTVAGFVAIDVADPRRPRPIHTELNVQYHGMRLSSDGRTLYAANIGSPGFEGITGGGLRIIDVSEIQERKPSPRVRTISDLSWDEMSIPQVAEPFTRNGRQYLLEVDEFVDLFSLEGLTNLRESPVGAARIIDIDDPRRPKVVSDLRLKVHQPDQRTGPQYGDPGAAFPAQGYAAHYCSVPKRKNPKLAACSMILSGLRIFDIRDPRRPREVAYFNQPALGGKLTVPEARGSYAMSQPAWDVKRRTIWFSDANSGFYAVRLTNGVGKLLRR